MLIIARPESFQAAKIKCHHPDGDVWYIAAVELTLEDPDTPDHEPHRDGHKLLVPLGGHLREEWEDRGREKETMEALKHGSYWKCQPNGLQMDPEIEEDPCEMDNAVARRGVHYSPYEIVDRVQTTDEIGKLMNMNAGDTFTIQAHQKLYPAYMPWTQVDGIEITVEPETTTAPHEQKKRKRDASDE